MNQLRKQSTFYQKMVSQAKLGAYYTEKGHCQSIAELLDFLRRQRYVFWNQQSVMQRLCVQ